MLPPAFTPKYLRCLELLELNARRSFLGTRQGLHKSRKRGYGMEFSDYRKYELGDDPRHIDWSAYARNEKLYVKTFEEEQDISVLLIVDGSASMFNPTSDKKWEMARDVALSLAYIALLQQDRVFVTVPNVFYSPAYSGGAAIHRLNDAIEKLEFKNGNSVVDGVRQAISHVRSPGLAIFISDFLMPLSDITACFNMLRAKNLELSAVQVLGENDLTPLPNSEFARVVDSESGEELEIQLDERSRVQYSALLEEHKRALEQFLFESQINYSIAEVAGGVEKFVLEQLAKTGLIR